MPTPFSPGDDVYVPALKVGITHSSTALKRVKVVAVNGRSITVNLPNGNSSTIGSKLAHKDVSVLLFRIGDFQTEQALLNPLTKSLLQFCRILLPDDQLKLEQIRTREEFCRIWNRDHALYSHVILVGHCDGTKMTFGTNQLPVSDFEQCFADANSSPKAFVSLACQSGKAGFAKGFSQLPSCRLFIGPFQACHGAVASLFCQTLLTRHFLDGMTLKSAFNNSANLPGKTSFRYWQDGEMR